jgi:hypothetical protein
VTGYVHDVFVSYARGGTVEPWVRHSFAPAFRRALQEELARSNVFVDEQIPTGVEWPAHLQYALLRSRVLVAVFSRQYFDKVWCRAEIDSMMLRRDRFIAPEGAPSRIPVHAIVVHDCVAGVPADYETVQRADFKSHAVGIYAPSKAYLKAVATLAEEVSETIRQAPPWSDNFPLAALMEEPESPPAMAKPRF